MMMPVAWRFTREQIYNWDEELLICWTSRINRNKLNIPNLDRGITISEFAVNI